MSLNRVLLQGRLTGDPELRHTTNGTAVANFRLAVDRDFKDKETGERKADFINVVAWRATGEFVSRYFAKGRMAIVEGKLQVREYTDRDGNKRYATDVIAESVYFGGDKRERDGHGNSYRPPDVSYGSQNNAYDVTPQNQFAELEDGEVAEEELPF